MSVSRTCAARYETVKLPLRAIIPPLSQKSTASFWPSLLAQRRRLLDVGQQACLVYLPIPAPSLGLHLAAFGQLPNSPQRVPGQLGGFGGCDPFWHTLIVSLHRARATLTRYEFVKVQSPTSAAVFLSSTSSKFLRCRSQPAPRIRLCDTTPASLPISGRAFVHIPNRQAPKSPL